MCKFHKIAVTRLLVTITIQLPYHYAVSDLRNPVNIDKSQSENSMIYFSSKAKRQKVRRIDF